MLAGLRSGALLRLSPEDLPLEPGHPRQSCLEFVGQIGDLSLLLPNDMLQMLCLLLPGRFPHGSTSMQRSPVVRLLTKLDLQTTDFDILHEHADMVENSTVCVQLPRMESPRRHEDEHGFTECLHHAELLARLRAAQRVITSQSALDTHMLAVHRLNAELEVANHRLRQLASIDELTQLPNRREATTRLHEYWAAASRQGRPLAAMVVDVDYFKRVNDEYGHAAGDAVLVEIASRLRNTVRKEDNVYRIGGEEFLVLCPDSSAKMAAAGAERVRRLVSCTPIGLDDGTLDFTVSIGVAERVACLVEPLDLVKAADEALYAAKNGGRNQVRVWTPPAPHAPGHASDRICAHPGVLIGDLEGAYGKVLIVDDDATVRGFARGLLQQHGYEVTEATSGFDALPKIERDKPDVLVADADMPLLNGLEFTQRMKQNADTADIPVIIVSRDLDSWRLRTILEAGADEVLPKPLVAEELLIRVRSMCWLHRHQQELTATRAMTGEHARAFVELLDYSSNIAATTGQESILDRAIEVTLNLVGARSISILMPDHDGKMLVTRRTAGAREDQCLELCLPLDAVCPVTEAFRSGRYVVVNNQNDAALCKPDSPLKPPLVAAPLMSHERAIGVLLAADRWNRESFNAAEIGYLEMIGHTTGAALCESALSASQREAHHSIVVGLAKLAEHRDNETGRHVERVTQFCRVLAEQLRTTPDFADQISDQYIDDIQRAAVLHDIGKVGIPDHILLKPGRLTEEEMIIMRTHAKLGAETIQSVIARVPGVTFLDMAVDIAYAHHEWHDGKGYPRNLAGDAIPLSARITAVADVYDALTSRRPYKEPMSHEKASKIIVELTGTQFAPAVVEAFQARSDEFGELAVTLADETLDLDSTYAVAVARRCGLTHLPSRAVQCR